MGHLERAAELLRDAGFDRVVEFDTRWLADVSGADAIGTFGRQGAGALLVANTAALWPRFMAAEHADADPLDTWVERSVRAALDGLPVGSELWFPPDPTPRRLPFQQIAQAAGLGALSPARLLIDPVVGPWISLRALVVLDEDGPGGERPLPTLACDACASGCEPAFRHAMAAPTDTLRWIAARDACPRGKAHRFDEHQLRYHYFKDAEALSYAPFWCEENIVRLARQERYRDGHAIFVTSPSAAVAMWSQHAGRDTDGLIVWDYHVVLEHGGHVVDFDCRSGRHLDGPAWLDASFPHRDGVPERFRPIFRVIPAAELQDSFSSDRSHMRTEDGSWVEPPPPWPPFGEGNRLPDLIDTSRETPGFRCDLAQFEHWLAKRLAGEAERL